MRFKGLLALLCLCILAACAPKSNPNAPIADLVNLAQDAGAYHSLEPEALLISKTTQEAAYQRFLDAHFGPWNRSIPKYSADEVFWGLAQYADKTLYGENTLPRSPAWMDMMEAQSRVAEYPSLHRQAIAVTNTSMRVLPTHRPAFLDPTQAGEGFPFDYMQNSLLLAGTPLFATHTSEDKRWVLVESRFAFGWVPARDIAWMDACSIKRFKTGTYAAITRDDLSINDTHGLFRFTGYVGTILPVMQTTQEDLICLLPARTSRGFATLKATKLSSSTAQTMPIPATPANFTRLANNMMGEQYGWGGLYEDRDCSALMLDLMAPFGIYLPRNSSQQIEIGNFTNLSELSPAEKKQTVLDKGVPFLTLIRKPGHIMLYVGQKDSQPMILHAAWGLKTKRGNTYGRRIIGGTVITTLEPGIELPDLTRPSGVYLDTLSGMSNLSAPLQGGGE
jgi:cell wall-associated NlpC family hydrolase